MSVQFRIYTLVLFLFVLGCDRPAQVFKNQNVGPALGTSYSIIYLSENQRNYQQEIDSVFAVVNQSMSTYIPTSDISRINQGDSTVVIDHMFKDVFLLSQKVYKATNGYFDPTVGTLVNAWGFGPGKQIVMDSTKVDSLLSYVGFSKVSLGPDNRIKKYSPEVYFDFNSIAKGYAIDRLAVLLDQKEISDYLIEVGGEVVAKGENTINKKKWTIGIDDPQVENGRTSKTIVQLQDKALASSGNYRKFRVDSLTGEKYVHTIDPKTGFTKNSNVLGATVIADDCATADAYATSFMSMDLEDSVDLLNGQNTLEAYIVYLNAEGKVDEFLTPGFKNDSEQ